MEHFSIIESEPFTIQSSLFSIDYSLYPSGIPLSYFIPKVPQNKYFYKNGLSKIIPRLKVKVHSQIEKCYDLWEAFSPKKTLFDAWDVRYAWYKGLKFDLFFYTLYENSIPLGVLPMWYDTDEKKFFWFGGEWMEDNIFFVKDEHFIDLLLAIIPTPNFLNAIDISHLTENIQCVSALQQDEPKFIKDISQYSTIDEFLGLLRKKDKYNLKSDYYKINSLSPKIVETEGFHKKIFEQMISLNLDRFDGIKRERSYFYYRGNIEAIKNVIHLGSPFKTKFIEVYIQNYLAAVDLILEYNNTYYMLIGGSDVSKFKGIGNFMIYLEMKDAIKRGYRYVDCFQIDYGWKHRFFDEKNVYKIER